MNDLQPINFPGLDPRRPLVIAGPCSAETEEQVIETARELAAEGFKLFRAGLWKPRTKPGGFEGVGVDGIAWLQRVKRETGMYTATEVATRKHVLAALEGDIDMIWIGARTTANPFAMQEIADALRGHDIPVLVKNPVSPDLELWIGGVERIYNAGIRRLGVIHRGFTSIDKSLYRNHPMWSIPIELHRRLFDSAEDAHDDLNRFFSDLKPVEIDGFLAMPPHEHLLYLILHAYKHFVGCGIGLRQQTERERDAAGDGKQDAQKSLVDGRHNILLSVL